MTHNLVAFAFFAILLALAYHFAFGEIYQHFFAGSFAFQTYWIVPFILVPALLQAGLAWLMGFWRRGRLGWEDAAVLVIIAAIVFLNLDASYSCGSGCF